MSGARQPESGDLVAQILSEFLSRCGSVVLDDDSGQRSLLPTFVGDGDDASLQHRGMVHQCGPR
jgi:hypothetical protein